MTADGFAFLEWFFLNIWKFFISWKVPGTSMTPASWMLFLLFAPLVLAFIQGILGGFFSKDD